MLAVGVDVGAGRFNVIAIEAIAVGPLRLVDRLVSRDAAAVVAFCTGADRVAIDAPSAPSAGAHLADESVAAKFRTGRCSEIPVPGVPPVSWVTPMAGEPVPGWMQSGFDLWDGLSTYVLAVETFPAACYHRLYGGRWPPRKTGAAGRACRLALLSSAGLDLGDSSDWGHDDLDAAVAALVAARGRPLPHHCPAPDGSRLWLV